MSTAPTPAPKKPPVPLFGRAYTLTITTKAGVTITLSNSKWEPEALRIVFRADQIALAAWYCADIVVYNLTVATASAFGVASPASQVGAFGSFNTAIEKDDDVVLSAGYQANFTATNSVIFRGKVWQPMWEREGARDNKLTLRCYQMKYEDDAASLNLTLGPGTTQEQAVRKVAEVAGIPISFLETDSFSKVGFPKALTIEGRPRKYFDDVASSNHLQCWFEDSGLVIASLSPSGSTPDITYIPAGTAPSSSDKGLVKRTVIGSPQQTENGVVFRVLMDTSARLRMLIKLDMVVKLLLKTYGNSTPSRLDSEQLYVIVACRYFGDTRGNEWHTEITAITRQYAQIYRGGR